MDSKAIKIFDLTKEIVDILSTMTQEELKYLKLQYEVVFKYDELLNMRKEIIGKDINVGTKGGKDEN